MKKLVKKSFSLFLAAILVINGLMLLNPLITKAAVSLPKVAVVSLDHYPFVEGDSNKFFISSKDFSGKVQYQLFYTCKRTMGANWELITNSEMTGGWTKAVDADEPITVDISSLNLKADYYRFAIRVRRVGYKGTYSNQYGDYDYAYPFSVKVVGSANINLNGDMEINKEVFVQGDSLQIDGIKGEDSSTKYKLHLYDVKNSRWLINLTDYDSSINYPLNNLPAGKYIVDVWGKKENSTSTYDGYKLKTIEVKEEALPKVAIVSLDHTPFKEGDQNKFFISSKEYDGQVQYQLFYTCKATMGTNWELINTDDMLDGWTKAVDAHEPITVDISHLNLKAEYYRFAIRVRRVGFKGRYSNKYGEYDNAYPFTEYVVKSPKIQLNGDMLIDKTEYAKNDQLVINGVNNVGIDTKYKLHLYDVKNNKWLTNLTDYEDKIDYDLSNIPEGKYIVDIWGKKNGSSSKYDGWKLKVINVTSDILKVTSVEDIEAETWKNSDYKLPERALAVMEDGSTHYKGVKWDGQANTSKEGQQLIQGDVLGYDKKINLSLNIKEGRGNSNGNIVNMGLVAKEGDWIYYCNHLYDGKLYKTDEEQSKIIKICDDFVFYINVVEDWIYYYNYSDGGKIYKIRTDGTGRTKLNNDHSQFINVVNGWIYYTNVSDGNKLYKIKTDGTERTKLNNDKSIYINVVDNYIYYTNDSDGDKIYKIKIDGTGRTKINNDESLFINVVGDWIYYSNGSDSDHKYMIYKVKTDGSNRGEAVSFTGAYLNVKEDTIYFYDMTNNGLSKIRINREGFDKIKDGEIIFTNVIDDKVYFEDIQKDFMLYRVKNYGGNLEAFGIRISHIDSIEASVYLNNDYTPPSKVTAYMEDSSSKKIDVVWDTSEMDTGKAGIYNITGTVKGYYDKVVLKLRVLGIKELKNISADVVKGDKYSLPQYVTAVMEDGAVKNAKVQWSVSEVDTSKAGIYTFEGTVDGYEGKCNLTLKVIEIEGLEYNNVDKILPMGVNYKLPTYIKANMNDGSTRDFKIQWSPSIVDTSKTGDYVYQGTIPNYDKTITYNISVKQNENSPTGVVLAKGEDVICFENMYDNNKPYMIKTDGTGKVKISDYKAEILEIKDGWIYYQITIEERDSYGNTVTSYQVHKIKTDGTGNIKLKPNRVGYFEIVDDWIYYKEISSSKLYKMKTDGTNKTEINIENSWSVVIKDGWIYYNNIDDNENYRSLYKMKIDGSEKIRLNSEKSDGIKIVGDWIYYRNINQLCKIKTDGTNRTVVCTIYDDYIISDYEIAGDWIYLNGGKRYSTSSREPKIWKVKCDGTEKSILREHGGDLIYVSGDWICITDNSAIYTTKTDGSVNKLIGNSPAKFLNVIDGWVYYKNFVDNEFIYKVRVDGTENQLVY